MLDIEASFAPPLSLYAHVVLHIECSKTEIHTTLSHI